MHFDLSVRRSPETKKPESYFRIKENYCDKAEVVRQRIMSTQKVLTTTTENKLGEKVAFRNCTVPETKVAEIYQAINYKQQPFKR